MHLLRISCFLIITLALIAEGKTKRHETNCFGSNRNIEEMNKTGNEKEAEAFENPYHGDTSSRANSE